MRVVKGPWFGHPIVRLAVAAALVLAFGALMRQLSALTMPASREARTPAIDRTAPLERMPGSEAPPAKPSAAASVFTVTLPSIVTRSAGQTIAEIPGTATLVQFRLEGPDPWAAALEADVRTVENRIVWQGLATRGSSGILAMIEVPADLLRPDDYVLTVSSGDPQRTEVARYSVRIKRP